MGAATTYYVKVPITEYVWREVCAVTADEALAQYPNAIEVKHWSQHENDDDE